MSGVPIDNFAARFGDVFRWGGISTAPECLVMFVTRDGNGVSSGQRNWVGMCLSDLSTAKVGDMVREWNPGNTNIGWTMVEAVIEVPA